MEKKVKSQNWAEKTKLELRNSKITMLKAHFSGSWTWECQIRFKLSIEIGMSAIVGFF